MAPEVMQAGEGMEDDDEPLASQYHDNDDDEDESPVEGEKQSTRLIKKKYGRKADVWSLGMTLCELASGHAPFKSAAAAIYSVCVSKKLPSFPDYYSDEAHSFLARCFVFEARRRADCVELKIHPFMLPRSEEVIRAQTAVSLSSSQHMQSTVMLHMPDDIAINSPNSNGLISTSPWGNDDSKWSTPTTVREVRTEDGSSFLRNTDFATDTKFMTCKLLPPEDWKEEANATFRRGEENDGFYSARDEDMFLSQHKSNTKWN